MTFSQGLVTTSLVFQSTPSSRRVTEALTYFETPVQISIHTLLAESDLARHEDFNPYKGFQSTPSSRRVTKVIRTMIYDFSISIHTLLAESDSIVIFSTSAEFISIHTLLAESDDTLDAEEKELLISIHTLLAESDRFNPRPIFDIGHFNPHPPRGE